MECAGCGSYDEVLDDCPLQWILIEIGSLGTTTNLGLFWGTPLGVTVRCCGKVISTCGLSGGGL